MFSGITNLTDLNRKRAELCRDMPRTEWPRINLAYSKAANEIRSAVKKTDRVNIHTIAPSVLYSAQPSDGVTDAMYDPATKCLVIFTMQNAFIKGIPAGSERLVKINMRQNCIEAGVQL